MARQQAILTVDLGYGDAGKGSVVDYLTRVSDAHTVVRYNGGAQAAHRVVTNSYPAQEHVFAQFGSGTLAGAATHLSRYMLLEPLAMLAEAEHLRTLGVADPFGRTTISDQALVITPFQRAVNRLREMLRGDDRHGSCGVGIGETMVDALAHGAAVLRAGDLADVNRLQRKLHFLQQVNRAKLAPPPAAWLAANPEAADAWALLHDDDWRDWLLNACLAFSAQAHIVPDDALAHILARPGTVIFEGAQGVLLDEWRGFHPYTTWSTTTLANADALLGEAGYQGQVWRLGITRAYATRHGAGPFVTEDAALSAVLPDARNRSGRWQGGFRVGWPDLVALRYASEVVGRLDVLAVTCLDRLSALPVLAVCDSYRMGDNIVRRLTPASQQEDLAYQSQLTARLMEARPQLRQVADVKALVREIVTTVGAPLGLTSHGASADDKWLHRALAQICTLATATV